MLPVWADGPLLQNKQKKENVPITLTSIFIHFVIPIQVSPCLSPAQSPLLGHRAVQQAASVPPNLSQLPSLRPPSVPTSHRYTRTHPEIPTALLNGRLSRKGVGEVWSSTLLCVILPTPKFCFQKLFKSICLWKKKIIWIINSVYAFLHKDHWVFRPLVLHRPPHITFSQPACTPSQMLMSLC